MKIDLVGRKRRGLALGLNEFAGYVSVAIVGFVTGYLASIFGLKPYPFYLGIVFVFLGLVISWVIVRDTKKFTLLEIKMNKEQTMASPQMTKITKNKSNLALRTSLLKLLGKTAHFWLLVRLALLTIWFSV